MVIKDTYLHNLILIRLLLNDHFADYILYFICTYFARHLKFTPTLPRKLSKF